MPSQEERYSKKDVYDWMEENETLEYADLRGSRLIGINLPKLSLKGVNFEGADLRYANLAGVILEGANLKNANLQGVKLTGASLVGANLENAHLDNANLIKTDLTGASLKNATLTHASLRTSLLKNTDFTNANLHGANLSGALECASAKFHNADLTDARGDYTGLDMQDLKKANAKVGGSMSTGFKTRVFDFFQTEKKKFSWKEWKERIRHPFKRSK